MLVSVGGYTGVTFTPQLRSEFIRTLSTSLGVNASTLGITNVVTTSAGEVSFFLEAPKSANTAAVVQSPAFIDALRAHGLTSATAVHVIPPAAPNTPASPDGTNQQVVIWATVGAVGGVVVVAGAAYVYWRMHMQPNAKGRPASGKTPQFTAASGYLRI